MLAFCNSSASEEFGGVHGSKKCQGHGEEMFVIHLSPQQTEPTETGGDSECSLTFSCPESPVCCKILLCSLVLGALGELCSRLSCLERTCVELLSLTWWPCAVLCCAGFHEGHWGQSEASMALTGRFYLPVRTRAQAYFKGILYHLLCYSYSDFYYLGS